MLRRPRRNRRSAAIRGMIDRKDRTHILNNFSKEKVMVSGKEDPIMPISDSKNISEKTALFGRRLMLSEKLTNKSLEENTLKNLDANLKKKLDIFNVEEELIVNISDLSLF